MKSSARFRECSSENSGNPQAEAGELPHEKLFRVIFRENMHPLEKKCVSTYKFPEAISDEMRNGLMKACVLMKDGRRKKREKISLKCLSSREATGSCFHYTDRQTDKETVAQSLARSFGRPAGRTLGRSNRGGEQRK